MRLFQFLFLGKAAFGRGEDRIGTYNPTVIENFEKFDPNDYPYDISHLARGQDKLVRPLGPKPVISKPEILEPVIEKHHNPTADPRGTY